MSADGWDALSEWHNAWLDADASGRGELRRQFGREHPELTAQADALATAFGLTVAAGREGVIGPAGSSEQ